MMSPRASILGGSWLNEGNAGSRYANLDNWADNSNENIGARGRSDLQRDRRARADRRGCAQREAKLRRKAQGRTFDWGYGSVDRSSALRSSTEVALDILGQGDALSQKSGDQPIYPASANTLRGPAERGVAARFLSEGQNTGTVETRGRHSSEGLAMARRYRNLIGRITSPRNMDAALRLTARGKRLTPGYLAFKEFSALNLADLAADMASGHYECGAPHEFYILDPKRRLISALPFRDRIAQQALCLVIAPIFDAAMLPRAFACRPGKGTHAGVILLQSDLRREARGGELYFLKTDFSRYFASIERPVLWRLIEAKISCRATLGLIEAMVPRTGIGLPIGSLTSQIFANLYTGATLDRLLQQDLGERLWYRYMDHLVVLGRSSAHLARVKTEIEAYAARELGLRFSKWQIASTRRGINFLGYRIWASHKLLRRDSVIRARRKIAALRERGDEHRLQQFLAAWLGHAGWADSANLIKSLDLPLQREKRG
jgi:hypothetical protein